jgi:hypothetical protein
VLKVILEADASFLEFFFARITMPEKHSVVYFLSFDRIKNSIFWNIKLYIPLNVNRRFGVICRIHLQVRNMSQLRLSGKQVSRRALLATNFKLDSSLVYSVTLNMDATRSSEKSVDFQRATWCYIPEDRTLRNHLCENLKSYMMNEIFNNFIVKVLKSKTPHSTRVGCLYILS